MVRTTLYKVFCHKTLFWAGYFVMYLLLGLSTTVLCSTFLNMYPPFEVEGGSVVARRGHDLIEINYFRKFTITKETEALVCRSIEKFDKSVTYELGCAYRGLVPGSFTMERVFIAPLSLPDGSYTFKTKFVWRPVFSLKYHIRTVTDMTFKICGNNLPCDNNLS